MIFSSSAWRKKRHCSNCLKLSSGLQVLKLWSMTCSSSWCSSDFKGPISYDVWLSALSQVPMLWKSLVLRIFDLEHCLMISFTVEHRSTVLRMQVSIASTIWCLITGLIVLKLKWKWNAAMPGVPLGHFKGSALWRLNWVGDSLMFLMRWKVLCYDVWLAPEQYQTRDLLLVESSVATTRPRQLPLLKAMYLMLLPKKLFLGCYKRRTPRESSDEFHWLNSSPML